MGWKEYREVKSLKSRKIEEPIIKNKENHTHSCPLSQNGAASSLSMNYDNIKYNCLWRVRLRLLSPKRVFAIAGWRPINFKSCTSLFLHLLFYLWYCGYCDTAISKLCLLEFKYNCKIALWPIQNMAVSLKGCHSYRSYLELPSSSQTQNYSKNETSGHWTKVALWYCRQCLALFLAENRMSFEIHLATITTGSQSFGLKSPWVFLDSWVFS